MQLGSIELQIFAALVLVLGSAFVALVCDFLKGNNEQLRERNIELRVRQDERERLGLFEPLAHPITWLQGLAALARNPALAEKVAGSAQSAAAAPTAAAAPHASQTEAPAAAPATATATMAGAAMPVAEPASAVPGVADLAGGAADRNPQRRHRYDEFKASARTQSWATKEELEQLAGRAARIRARHEASQRKQEESIGLSRVTAPAEPELAASAGPAPAVETKASALKPELLKPVRLAALPPPPPAAVEEPAAPDAVEPVAPGLPLPIESPMATAVVAETALQPVAAPEPAAEAIAASGPVVIEPVVTAVETAAPVAEPEPAPALLESVPPMIETPAPAPWTFQAVAEERPRAVDIPAAAASTSLGVVKPDAPSLWSRLAEAELPEPALVEPEVVAEVAAGPAVEAPELAMAPALAETEPSDSLELRTRIHQIEVPALAEATTEDLEVFVTQPEAVTEVEEAQAEPEISIWRTPPEAAAVASVPAAVPEPEPEISIWRTSPQPPSGIAIDIEPAEAAYVAAPAPPPPPPMPVVEARPVNTEVPAYDVAALQKATGASTPSRIPPMGAMPESGAAADSKLDLPPGLHESAVLSQLIESQTPFSGVVVAIGLNDYDSLRDKLASGTDSVAALSRMVLSMLRAQDFACRFQEDEYILIYPGERGSSAQRRLFQVSEKLWDFQLRSLGNLSVMFSWGGLEVTNETLAEAVASARERMYQTKRNRKPASLDFAVGRKKVVNG